MNIFNIYEGALSRIAKISVQSSKVVVFQHNNKLIKNMFENIDQSDKPLVFWKAAVINITSSLLFWWIKKTINSWKPNLMFNLGQSYWLA